MRICVVSSTVFALPPAGYSGLEFLAWQQSLGLAAKGHRVTVVAPQGSTCPGCEIIATGPPGGWNEQQAFLYYKDRLAEFDVILDHTWMKFSYLLKRDNKLNIPILGVMHAPVNTMYQSLPPVDKPSMVCISQDQASHFEALYGRPCRYVHNGIDLDFYKPTGVPRTDRFLFLARFSSIKGPDIAIEACKRAGVGLDLIGDTSITGEPEYLEKCKQMCDGRQIRLIGPASRSECVHWFSQAHCFLHPNQRFREPLGLAPLEAQACGLPVIGWDYGALRETIQHNKTGWLVNSIEEMVCCIHAAMQTSGSGPLVPITKETRDSCRANASRFTVQRMIDRYEALLEEALRTGGW